MLGDAGRVGAAVAAGVGNMVIIVESKVVQVTAVLKNGGYPLSLKGRQRFGAKKAPLKGRQGFRPGALKGSTEVWRRRAPC